MNIIIKAINAFNDLNMRKKLTLTCMLVVFMPVLVVGIFLTENMKDTAVKNAVKKAANDLDRVIIRVESILEIPLYIASKLSNSQQLESVIYKEFESDWDVIDSYINYREFDAMKVLYKEIADIRLYVTSRTMLENWRFMEINDGIRKQPWFVNAIESAGKTEWIYMKIPDEFNKEPAICMVKFLKSVRGKELGVLVIKLDMDEINSILRQEFFETMIIDSSNTIIAASDSRKIGMNNGIPEYLSVNDRSRTINDIDYNGKPAKMIADLFYSPQNEQSFRVVSIIALDDILTSAGRARLLGLGIIAASLILSIGLIIFFSKALSDRISKISNDMSRVASGDLAFESNIDGNDEIGQLSKDLNMMVRSINTLVHEAYHANFEKNQLLMKQKEIKLSMLANQMNPHFLFNALEAVRMKAISLGDREIAGIVKLLARLMRINLNMSSELITLQRELEQVGSYLEIQKFRYGDKIDYRIAEVSDRLLNSKILPLIIQPVVENAVIHGIENKEEKGSVHVKIDSAGGMVEITVTDDGVGMDEAKLASLLKLLDEKDDLEEKKIGLKNIHQRIKLYYGAQYGIEINSRLHSGTSVIIRIREII